MVFNIESIKKNFKDVTDKTVRKTGELTTIAKLNLAIKSEESKLSTCYKAIGRLFYTAERDNLDNTEEIATYIMQADKIKASITEYQKELAILRNVVICEGCSNEISNECIFCPICGLKVAKPAPAEDIVEEAVEETAEECCCCEEAAEECCCCEEAAEECCCCEEATEECCCCEEAAEECCCEEAAEETCCCDAEEDKPAE